METSVFCERCGERIPDLRAEGVGVEWVPPRKGVANHLRSAFGVIRRDPKVFAFEIVGSVVYIIQTKAFGILGEPKDFLDLWEGILSPGRVVTVATNGYPDIPPEFWADFIEVMMGVFVFLFVVDLISKIFTIACIDYARNAYLERDVGLMSSARYFLSRGWIFLAASIVGLLLQFTVVLVLLSLLMFVEMVVGEAGLRDSIVRGFRLGINNFGTVTGLFILWFIAYFVLDMTPYIPEVARTIPSVVFYLALIDLHYQSERA